MVRPCVFYPLFSLTTLTNTVIVIAALGINNPNHCQNHNNASPTTTSAPCTPPDALAPSSSSSSNRRSFLITTAALSTLLIPSTPTIAATSQDNFKVIVSQSQLLAPLTTTSPPRSVIITGANSGVGLAGAKLLVAAGHRVILACRTLTKATTAAKICTDYAQTDGSSDPFFTQRRTGGVAIPKECDLSSLQSIRSFAQSIIDEGKEGNYNAVVDSLVLNAGLAQGQGDTTVYRTTDGFEETVGVNHLGHFLLANLLSNELSKSRAVDGGGRLVSTASSVHDPKSGGGDVGLPATLGSLQGMKENGSEFTMVDGGPYDADKAYKDSKLCNLLFVQEAARRYEGKFTVNAFAPGLIADPNGFFRNQNRLFASAFNTITKTIGVAESNEFGGSALAYMAVSGELEGVTGKWYDSAPVGKHSLTRHLPSVEAQNVEEQGVLWGLSEKLVGI